MNVRNAQSNTLERQNASYTNALANIVVPSRITISSSSPLLFLHILTNLVTPLTIFFNSLGTHSQQAWLRTKSTCGTSYKQSNDTWAAWESMDAMNKISYFLTHHSFAFYILKLLYVTVILHFLHSFSFSPRGRFVFQIKISGKYLVLVLISLLFYFFSSLRRGDQSTVSCLAKISTHSTTWQLKTIKFVQRPFESLYVTPGSKLMVPKSIPTSPNFRTVIQ